MGTSCDLLFIARAGDPKFHERFLKEAECCVNQIRPLQLATLIGIKLNSHLRPLKREKSFDKRKIVCVFALALIKKVHQASERDIILLNQLIVNLTHIGCYDSLVLATLRNAYLRQVLIG